MFSRYLVPAIVGVAVAACSPSLQLGSGSSTGPRAARPAGSGGGNQAGPATGGASNKAEMPDVKGMAPADAEHAVVAAGFAGVRFKTISQSEAPGCEPGVVCQSNPPAGTQAYVKMPKVLYVVGEVCYHPTVDDPRERFECEGDDGGDDDDGGDGDDLVVGDDY